MRYEDSLNVANRRSAYRINERFSPSFAVSTSCSANDTVEASNTMQISSLAITLSLVASLTVVWKCAETVTVVTNQTDVDETYSLTWPPDTRQSPSNVTLKTKKIFKRQAAGQDDTSDSSVAATAEQHQQSVDALGAARQPRLQQQTTPKGQCS